MESQGGREWKGRDRGREKEALMCVILYLTSSRACAFVTLVRTCYYTHAHSLPYAPRGYHTHTHAHTRTWKEPGHAWVIWYVVWMYVCTHIVDPSIRGLGGVIARVPPMQVISVSEVRVCVCCEVAMAHGADNGWND